MADRRRKPLRRQSSGIFRKVNTNGGDTAQRYEVFRSRGRLVFYLVLGGLSGAIALAWVVSAFSMSETGTRVILALVFLALALLAAVWARASVMVSRSAGTVVVRNPLRRVSIPLDRVAGFEVQTTYRQGNKKFTVWLNDKDGYYLRCPGVTSSARQQACVRLAGSLNRAIGLANTTVREFNGNVGRPMVRWPLGMGARRRPRTPRKVREWR